MIFILVTYINSPDKMPISYAMQLYSSRRGGEYALVAATATMSTIPVILLFFFSQKYFFEGVTLSGFGGRWPPLRRDLA